MSLRAPKTRLCCVPLCKRRGVWFMAFWDTEHALVYGRMCPSHDSYWARRHIAEALGLDAGHALSLDRQLTHEPDTPVDWGKGAAR